MHDADMRTFTVAIARPADIVYGFASDVGNLGLWASAFGPDVHSSGEGKAVAETPEGRVAITFAPLNSFGVLDHWATNPDGAQVYVPMRVLQWGDGAVVLFTLFRGAASAERFREDCDWVMRDLAKLKALLEA